jgi:hypothetical protein
MGHYRIGAADSVQSKRLRTTADENWTDFDHAIIEDAKTDKLPDEITTYKLRADILRLGGKTESSASVSNVKLSDQKWKCHEIPDSYGGRVRAFLLRASGRCMP